MISQFFIAFIKIVVMLFILIGMVLILIGIQHYLNKIQRDAEMDDSINDRFRKQIDSDRGVLSSYNLFSRFFVSPHDSDKIPTIPKFFQGKGIDKYNKETHQSYVSSIKSGNHKS